MTRLLTGLALVAFAVYLIFIAPQTIFIAGALLMGILCYREFAPIVAAHHLPRPGLIGYLLGACIVVQPQHTLACTSLALIAQLVLLLRSPQLKEIVPRAACVLLGAFYVFTPWRFAVDLRTVSVHLLFFALALNWVGDSTAYYIGSYFGRHKLAPAISPGKSWEGSAASVVGGLIFGVIYLHTFVPRISYPAILTMAIIGNVAGQLGDLVESAVKRGAGVKDSGALLPGHGGVLDRLDSSLFSLPVIYVLARAFTLF